MEPRNSIHGVEFYRMRGYAHLPMASPRISLADLQAHRARTYRLSPSRRLKTREQAVAFVRERGFTYFWPIQGVELPSLWNAVAGDRAVASAHDDPGHVTWGWKDSLLGTGVWHYAKLLRGKATLISPEAAPYFYALTENFGDPREDAETLYRAGALTREAIRVFEVILDKGRQHTIALRRETGMTSRDSNTRFERALTELQTHWLIAPAAVAQAGAWRYAFVYESVVKLWPDLAGRAEAITRREARRHILDLYLQSVGAATPGQAHKLLRWTKSDVLSAGQDLATGGRATEIDTLGSQPGPWWVNVDLVRPTHSSR